MYPKTMGRSGRFTGVMPTPMNPKATAELIKTAAPTKPGERGFANPHERMSALLTCSPIEPGEVGSMVAEFGRIPDVQRLFGIKRGQCYQLIGSGDFKSVCLRKPGARTGVRLIHLASVRDWLTSQLA